MLLLASKKYPKYLLVIIFLVVMSLFHVDIASASSVITIHVDINNPKASDANNGQEDMPFKTIGAALNFAAEAGSRAEEISIIIHEGVYREQLTIKSGDFKGKLTIESFDDNSPVISGADIWDDWTANTTEGVYRHTWPYNWGVKDVSQSFERIRERLKPITLRREMIFVDGNRLTQVLEYDQLDEGTFFVDEDAGKVFIFPADIVDIDKTVIEVSNREFLFEAVKLENITVRGLVFQYSNGEILSSAVSFVNCSNVLIEDCRFVSNNWRGLKFGGCVNVTVRNSIANYNGAIGMGGRRIKNLTMEDCETNYNNWRGAQGEFYGWMVAGVKLMNLHGGEIKRHKSKHNYTRGFWLDIDNRDVTIEDCEFSENYVDGIFIEATQGPVYLKESRIESNHRDGIRIANCDNLYFENNFISNNADQIFFVSSGRVIERWGEEDKIELQMDNINLSGNKFIGTDAAQMLIGTSLKNNKWRKFIHGLKSDNNVWYNPYNIQGFQVWQEGRYENLDFQSWKNLAGKDQHSTDSMVEGKKQ